jgi:site-specific DNA-methyltransferase (adenine-specific)
MGSAGGMSNHLYYGDNLDILRNNIADESVDLIYLDPPFNSQANYNVLFKAPSGQQSEAQIEAFEDTWHWNEHAESAFDELMHSGNADAAEMLRAMRSFLKENDMMAYLTMMAIRLIELHRVLKATGSLYLHCDPTASHYLKILLDAVFGAERFQSEIVWKRTSAHSNATRALAAVHDIILLYRKGDVSIWNQLFVPYSDEYIAEHFVHLDPDGRRFRRSDLVNPGVRPNLRYDYLASNGRLYKPHSNGWKVSEDVMRQLDKENRLFFPAKEDARLRKKLYLDESPGVPIADIWDDLPPIHASAQERLGYPTQKPLALMERILQASSNEGDIVLDPFCGCGTTIHAAQKVMRNWIGIDITHLAISLIEKRLNDAFPDIEYTVHGTPKDVDGARALAEQDKYQFQWWAVSLINAVPYGGKKKGADGGIDGFVYFKPDGKTTEKAIVSVKGGENVNVAMIRDMGHVVDREKAKVGIFITLADATGPMKTEAVKAGFYETPHHGKVPKLQILTIADLFAGKKPQIPFVDATSFKAAPREKSSKQEKLL